MNPFQIFISKFYEVVIIALTAFLLLVVIGFGIQSWRLDRLEATHQAYIDNQDMLLAQAQADAAAESKRLTEKALEAERNYNVQIKQISTDARAADAAVVSLSKQLSESKRRLHNATKETIIEYVNTGSDVLEDVLTECRAVAKAADEHAADAKRLIESWPE